MKPFSLITPCFVAIALVCSDGKITAQSTYMNYILTKTMLDDTGTTSLDRIDYYDGLGRPVGIVQKAASPANNDIDILQEYDSWGRISNSWQPISVPTNTGSYYPSSTLKHIAPGFYNDSTAYANPVYEPSPLSRVLEQYGPGTAWRTAGRSVKTGYLVNTASGVLSCGLYAVATATSLKRTGFYAANELSVAQTTDENQNISYAFTDKQGRTLLQREMNGSVQNDTYFVYDDLGNLCYVLSPLAADALAAAATWDDTNAALKNYAYIYKYDERSRCTQKKLPGCEPVTMKYDKADRLVFSQDGNQKARNEWTFLFHDVFGRQTVTGTWKSTTVPATENMVVKTDYTGTGTLAGHAVNLTLPPVNLMTVNYYDNYNFVDILTAAEKAKMPYAAVSGYDAQYSNAKGLLTGTRTYQANDPAKYTVSALYYDHRGRVVQSHTSNHLGGFEDEYFAYTFTGKVRQRQHVHSAMGKTTQAEVYAYAYDHAERLLSVTHKLNAAAAVTLATNTYDEAGRLKTKKLATETATYSYNVRGWLTQVAGTKFNQTLTYNAAVNGVTPATAAYNGNMSATRWKAGDEATERGYQFGYDGLDRLISAYYGEGASLTANPNRYNELVTYDKTGNILTLQRQGKTDTGFGLIDNLTCNTYDGNWVTKITDAVTPGPLYAGAFHFMDGANVAVEYTYDANGNLKKDYNKKIVDIAYNSLNLPDGLQFTNGNTTSYVYDAAGQKLSVTHLTAVAGVTVPMTSVMTPLTPAQVYSTFKTDYCGSVVYENGAASRILTGEGYITLSGPTPVYHYYLRDHQGNNRVVLNRDGTVEQVNHYYPFGGLSGESTAGGVQPYKYNGKELDRMHGLDLFDYGARHYDAAVGRWWGMDPLAEKYYGISPYVYVANNPVRFIDPDGKSPYYNQRGVFLGVDKDGFAGKVIISTMENYIYAVTKNKSLIDNKFIEDAKLSARAYSNIYTHILKESGFDTKMLIGNSVAVKTDNGKFNDPSKKEDLFISTTMTSNKKEFKISVNQSAESLSEILSTVENIQNALGEHEFRGHGIMRFSDAGKDHYKAYELQLDSKNWEKTTPFFQEEILKRYLDYLQHEIPK